MSNTLENYTMDEIWEELKKRYDDKDRGIILAYTNYDKGNIYYKCMSMGNILINYALADICVTRFRINESSD